MTLHNALKEYSSYISMSAKILKFNSVMPEAGLSKRYTHKALNISTGYKQLSVALLVISKVYQLQALNSRTHVALFEKL